MIFQVPRAHRCHPQRFWVASFNGTHDPGGISFLLLSKHLVRSVCFSPFLRTGMGTPKSDTFHDAHEPRSHAPELRVKRSPRTGGDQMIMDSFISHNRHFLSPKLTITPRTLEAIGSMVAGEPPDPWNRHAYTFD